MIFFTWIIRKLKRNTAILNNLKPQRLLITTEKGIITSATPVPDDCYIAHTKNIETVIKLCRASSS